MTVTHLQEHPGDEPRAVVGPDVSPEVRQKLIHASLCYCVSDTAGCKTQDTACYRVLRFHAYVVGAQFIQRPVLIKLRVSKP